MLLDCGTRAREAWCLAHLGSSAPRYPGHPVVLACMVMDRYASLAHATQASNALRDGFIPGAGCAVGAALGFLQLWERGGPQHALSHGAAYWDNWEAQHVNNKEGAALGRAQAEKLLPYLQENVEAWMAGSRQCTPFTR